MSKPLIFGSGVSSFKDSNGLMRVCEAAIDNGILCFDTAPSYRTEEVLAQTLSDVARRKGLGRESLAIQTKIDPIQMFQGDVENYFKAKLKAMRLDYVDALLVHWPVRKYFMKTWEAMNKLKEAGLTRRVGICNLRIEHLRELQAEGIIPEILQIECHPLNTFTAEKDFCAQQSIALQDYSPLCKMHPLLAESPILKQMAEKYSRSIGSLILRWHLDTAATPIFTSKNVSRIAEYAAVDEFRLAADDIAAIESLNINHKLYLESLVCPGF